jgi:hypothetical protein
MKLTIRKWLALAGFNFDDGDIVYQKVLPGQPPGLAKPMAASIMPASVLDEEFEFSGCVPTCPRFFARCGNWIYYPSTNGAGPFSLGMVNIDPDYYLNPENPTPYPKYF